MKTVEDLKRFLEEALIEDSAEIVVCIATEEQEL
jgi:hypothetical protein